MINYNRNPNGNGGFKEHPENIHKGGTPGSQGLRLLREALEKRAKTEGKSLFEHFAKLAFADKTILIEAMKKLVPNAQAIEITGEMTLKDFFGVLRGEGLPESNEPEPKADKENIPPETDNPVKEKDS